MNRLLLLCAALFAAAACAVSERLEPAHVQTQTVTYKPSNQAFLNPERGFHGNVSLVDETDLSWVRGEGHSLVRAYVRLDDHRRQPLPKSLLSDIERGLDAARKAGIKVVLRLQTVIRNCVAYLSLLRALELTITDGHDIVLQTISCNLVLFAPTFCSQGQREKETRAISLC